VLCTDNARSDGAVRGGLVIFLSPWRTDQHYEYEMQISKTLPCGGQPFGLPAVPAVTFIAAARAPAPAIEDTYTHSKIYLLESIRGFRSMAIFISQSFGRCNSLQDIHIKLIAILKTGGTILQAASRFVLDHKSAMQSIYLSLAYCQPRNIYAHYVVDIFWRIDGNKKSPEEILHWH
jgi:hypothetical protein